MTMLVTILGIGQFVGQLFFGFLANYSVIDELILYNIGAIVCGIASCLIPFVVHSYSALVMTILLFGLAISANYALTSIILANMCGLELLTSAYGLILLGQGLSSLFGPVLGGETKLTFAILRVSHALSSLIHSGWIAEHYGYKASLLIAGAFMGLSGCVTIVLYITQWIRSRNAHMKKEELIKANTKMITSDRL